MQNFKYIIISLLSIFITTATVVPVYAQTIPAATNSGKTIQSMDLTSLKTKADAEIIRRIVALQALITKLQNSPKLSAEKTTRIAEIQTTIGSLTTLKATIDGDTDLATLRTDIQSLISSYRIFTLYMPKNSLLIAANSVLTAVDKLAGINAQLQTKIQTAQTAGQDVTTLQTALTDMQTKLADAKTQAQNVITTVTPLTPTGFPANITTIQSAKQMLATAIQDIKTAGQDAKTVYKGLKMNKPTNAATPSAKPTL